MVQRGIGWHGPELQHREKLSDRQEDIMTWVILSSLSTLVVQSIVVPIFSQARQTPKTS